MRLVSDSSTELLSWARTVAQGMIQEGVDVDMTGRGIGRKPIIVCQECYALGVEVSASFRVNGKRFLVGEVKILQ